MRIAVSACTDTGRKRAANEDFYALEEKLGLFIVADGLGGHAGGRRAAELGVGSVVETVSSDPEGRAPEILRLAFARASAAIQRLAQAETQLRGMGTTLAVLWLRGEVAVLAHAGDSRLYLLRAGRLHALSLDHSLVGERVARGELSAEQARTHPSRHVITRAVGVLAAVEPDVATLRARVGDLFLICSDGISSQIGDADMARCLAKQPCAGLEAAAAELVAIANARGGEDNATVVLVAVEP